MGGAGIGVLECLRKYTTIASRDTGLRCSLRCKVRSQAHSQSQVSEGQARSAWRFGVASRLQRAGKREALTNDYTFRCDTGQFLSVWDSPTAEVAANLRWWQ